MRLIDADLLKFDFCDGCNSCKTKDVCGTIDLIDEQPTVDPVKHGHWEYDIIDPNGADSVKVTAHCSECGCTNSISSLYGMGNLSDDKRTPIVWSGFFTNFYGHEEQARDFAIYCAEHMKTFNFCPDCGAIMCKEVKYSDD